MRHGFFKWVGLASCLLATSITLGVHWYVLQSVAWARMLAAYSRADTLRVAVQKTFGGKHPCALCLEIRYGRQQEEKEQNKAPSQIREYRFDLFNETKVISAPLPPTRAAAAIPFHPRAPASVSHAPLKPPPRLS